MKKSEWLSIPNLLSLARIALIPLFIFLYFYAETKREYLYAAGIVVLSGITDALDGYIARNYNQITQVGKILDPLADKLTQLAIIICLMLTWPYTWILVAIFTIKELSLLVGQFFLMRSGQQMDGALWYGKVSTAALYVSTILLVAFPYMPTSLAYTLIILTGLILLMAFFLYTRWFMLHLK